MNIRSGFLAGAAALALLSGIPAETRAAGVNLGYGKNITGGRGGALCFVTSLADGGSGTLRNCLATTGAKTIVFRVSGAITLASPIITGNGNTTVAGETAPGNGIDIVIPNSTTWAGPALAFKGAGAGNVIVSHIRFRSGTPASSSTRHSLLVLENIGTAGANIHHVSGAGGSDEGLLTTFKDVRNVTLAYSLNAWPLMPRGKGAFICDNSGTCGRTTLIQNLFAHGGDRNPNVDSGGSASYAVDVINNVVADTEVGAEVWAVQGGSRANIVGNQYIGGPALQTWSVCLQIDHLGATGVPAVYAPLPGQGAPASHVNDCGYPIASQVLNGTGGFVTSPVATLSADLISDPSTVWTNIKPKIGARPQTGRDALDALAIACVDNPSATGCPSGGTVTSLSQVGYSAPPAGTETPYADTDSDGMDDAVEATFGGTVGTADHNGDTDGDGMTNLEEFLGWKSGSV